MAPPPLRPRRPVLALVPLVVLAALVAGCLGVAGAAPTPGATPAAAAPPRVLAASSPATATAPADAVAGGRATPEPSEPPEPPEPPETSEPTTPPVPTATPGPFAVDLYDEADDFVPQYTFEWCVGASLQMTLHLLGATDDRSRTYQQRLWEMARDRSFSPYGGANPRGWAAALNDLGVGPYELVSMPDLETAVETAARALRETGRPVGLVMWRGRHAWVMTGFESIGDPLVHDDVTVTGVRVLDPLYPHGSSVWGRSPKPDSLLTLDELGRQFVRRENRARYDLGVASGYLLVLPVGAPTAAGTRG